MPELTLNVPDEFMHLMPQIIGDLDASQKALQQTSQDAPNRDILNENYASALTTLYEVVKQPGILQGAIELQEQALQYRPNGHPLRVATLERLGNMVGTMCERHDSSLARLTRGVEIQHELHQFKPSDDPSRLISLNHLANALLASVAQVGDLTALEKAIELLREALTLCPASHPERDSVLNNLANALSTKYRSIKEAREDILREVLALHQECISHRPPGHPRRALALNNMAGSLLISYETIKNMENLQQAISLLRECVQLCPPGHPNRDSPLNTLGSALMLNYKAQPESGTLQAALDCLRESLSLRPRGHPNRPSSIINISEALMFGFEHEGRYDNVEEVVEILREAAFLCPPGHVRHQQIMHQLGYTLMLVFEYGYDFAALADAISIFRKILIYHGYPAIGDATPLINLASALLLKYGTDVDRDPHILAEAVGYHRQALQLCPSGHPKRHLSLNGLGVAVYELFLVEGNSALLHEAAMHLTEALDLRPQGHENRAATLDNLSNVLLSLYDLDSEVEILNKMIDYSRESLSLRPQGHRERNKSISNLGLALRKMHGRTGEFSFLKEEIELYEEGLNNCAEGHPYRGRFLCLLAACRLVPNSSFFDFKTGADLISESLKYKLTSIGRRITDAMPILQQMEAAYRISRDDEGSEMTNEWDAAALNAYDQFIDLLPLYAGSDKQHATRLKILAGVEGIIRDGATRAIGTADHLNSATKAVEMLEEGFGIFWQQALRLRSPDLNHLEMTDRLRLQEIFGILSTDVTPGLETVSSNLLAIEQQESQLEHRRRLGHEAEQIIARIRLEPGRDRFLKPPSWQSLLRSLPKDSHVVILVPSSMGNHAMVLSRKRDDMANIKPLHLSNMNISGVVEALKDIFRGGKAQGSGYALFGESSDEVVTEVNRESSETRAMSMARATQRKNLEDFLAQLFDIVVKPVVNLLCLKKSTGRNRPRVWWLAAGDYSSLPIHAAGTYKNRSTRHNSASNDCASDYMVSSYLPSLSCLAQSRNELRRLPRTDATGLVVQASTPGRGFTNLPQVADEARLVLECFRTGGLRVSGNADASSATVSSTLENLRKDNVNFVHFACHGIQKDNALQSAFILSDGDLTIEELMKLDLQSKNACLAFLSACETAKSSPNQPDQAVHLAASMLFCGFWSVVATMWSMADADGPTVAKHVYDYILKSDTFDLDDVPYALDEAVQLLRDKGVPASRWAPFMHMGG